MEPIGIIIRRFVNLSQIVPVCLRLSLWRLVWFMNIVCTFFCAHDDDHSSSHPHPHPHTHHQPVFHEYRVNLFFAHMMMTIPHPHNHRHSQHQPVFHEYRLNLFIAHM